MKFGHRKLKKIVLAHLSEKDFPESLEEICSLPSRQVVNPLFSFFYSEDERIKWRAISAMGAVVSRLADQDMESARVIMRRLIWNLNDESGGIGWGSPEAMGEIMARNQRMADEYACMIKSYLNPCGNFLEHEILQRGVLWGAGRLANARPEYIEDAALFVIPFLRSEDPFHRGFAAWVLNGLGNEIPEPERNALSSDNATLSLFIDHQLLQCTVGQITNKFESIKL